MMDTSLLIKLKPALEKVEVFRVSAFEKRAKKMRLLGLMLLGVLIVLVFAKFHLVFCVIAAVIVVIGGGIFMRYINAASNDYKTLYKELVTTQITSFLQPEVRYSPLHGIFKKEFESIEHYKSRIDRYWSEDLFEGKIGKTSIKFSEVHAERKETTVDSKGRRRTHYVTVFKGIPVILDFNKSFFSWVTVKPDFAEQNFGFLGRKLQGMSSNLVRLENPEFEKAFVVHSGDPVEARYLLTPDMQERLLEVRRIFGRGVIFSFRNSTLFITLPMSKDFFEPDIKVSAFDSKEIKRFASQMNLIFSLVEDLDLNTRIWSKQ